MNNEPQDRKYVEAANPAFNVFSAQNRMASIDEYAVQRVNTFKSENEWEKMLNSMMTKEHGQVNGSPIAAPNMAGGFGNQMQMVNRHQQ